MSENVKIIEMLFDLLVENRKRNAKLHSMIEDLYFESNLLFHIMTEGATPGRFPVLKYKKITVYGRKRDVFWLAKDAEAADPADSYRSMQELQNALIEASGKSNYYLIDEFEPSIFQNGFSLPNLVTHNYSQWEESEDVIFAECVIHE